MPKFVNEKNYSPVLKAWKCSFCKNKRYRTKAIAQQHERRVHGK